MTTTIWDINDKKSLTDFCCEVTACETPFPGTDDEDALIQIMSIFEQNEEFDLESIERFYTLSNPFDESRTIADIWVADSPQWLRAYHAKQKKVFIAIALAKQYGKECDTCFYNVFGDFPFDKFFDEEPNTSYQENGYGTKAHAEKHNYGDLWEYVILSQTDERIPMTHGNIYVEFIDFKMGYVHFKRFNKVVKVAFTELDISDDNTTTLIAQYLHRTGLMNETTFGKLPDVVRPWQDIVDDELEPLNNEHFGSIAMIGFEQCSDSSERFSVKFANDKEACGLYSVYRAYPDKVINFLKEHGKDLIHTDKVCEYLHLNEDFKPRPPVTIHEAPATKPKKTKRAKKN